MKICEFCLVSLSLPCLVGCGSLDLDYVFPQSSQATKLAASSGANSLGVSAPDSDKDGVPDWADLCGESVEEILVDASGCEAITGVVEGLEFAPDDTELSEAAKAACNKPY